MSRAVRRQIGQLIVAGFDGPTIPVELAAIAREFDLGGVILFARNIEAPLQVAELAYEAKRLGHELPLWVSVDQEGGRVQRLRAPCTEWPPVATIGRCGDPVLAARFASALAHELRALGITLDYAPVLDVQTNPRNPVIGDRALSGDAEQVAELGAILLQTIQAEGIAACGKHFPGHGDTSVDSHEDLPVVEQERPRLDAVELRPFRAAIAAGVAMLMTAHVRYPALDDDAPATLSRTVVTDLLRGELGFDGLVATDDMAMGAITRHRNIPEASVEALDAGCDLLLLCGTDVATQAAAIERLIHAVEDEELPVRRVEAALARQRRAKERFLVGDSEWRPPPARRLEALLGCDEHQAIARRMREFADA